MSKKNIAYINLLLTFQLSLCMETKINQETNNDLRFKVAHFFHLKRDGRIFEAVDYENSNPDLKQALKLIVNGAKLNFVDKFVAIFAKGDQYCDLHYLSTEQRELVELFKNYRNSLDKSKKEGLSNKKALRLRNKADKNYKKIQDFLDLNNHVDINFIYRDKSLLHAAIICSDIKLATLLLSKGADINIQNEPNDKHYNLTNGTPLHIAILLCQDNEEMVRFLITNNANVNAQDNYDGNTPLNKGLNSVLNIKPELIKILVNNFYFDPFIKNNDGQTSLEIAQNKANNKEISSQTVYNLETILENPGAGLPNYFQQAANIIEQAEQIAAKKLFIALLITIKENLPKNFAKLISQRRELALSIRDQDGNTILHLAIKEGSPEIITQALNLLPEQIDIKNNKDETPITFSLATNFNNTFLVLKALYDKQKEKSEHEANKTLVN